MLGWNICHGNRVSSRTASISASSTRIARSAARAFKHGIALLDALNDDERLKLVGTAAFTHEVGSAIDKQLADNLETDFPDVAIMLVKQQPDPDPEKIREAVRAYAKLDLQRHPGRLALPTAQLTCADPLPGGGQQIILVLLHGIYEYQTCDFIRILSIENAHVVSAKGMAHKDERCVLARTLE